MAELLIKIKNYTHPDPNIDRQGAYKKGMIVHVVEDGYPWARKESKQEWLIQGNDAVDWHGRTAILKIPGLAVAKVKELMSVQSEDDTGAPHYEDDGIEPRMYRKRRWWLLIDSIPQSIKNAIQADGEVTVTKNQIRNYLKRIRDNAQYTEAD